MIDVVSSLRWNFLELTDDAATIVDFDFLVASLAVQHIFVVALNSQFPDVMGGSVVSQLAILIQSFNVFIVNLRHVANDMGERGTIRVEPALIALHFNAREAVLVNGKTCNLDFGQVSFDGNRGKAVRTCALFLECRNIVIGQVSSGSGYSGSGSSGGGSSGGGSGGGGGGGW